MIEPKENNDEKEGGSITITQNKEEPNEDSTVYFIGKDDLEGLKRCFAGGAKVEEVDQHGMTLLQHAAYRGNKDICQYLIDQGADVNGGAHNNGYTCLHFASLSGNEQLCQLFLQNGAQPSTTNSVGRTAAQMAAFVGNHNCVSVINNFINRKDVEYFSIPKGLETVPKMDPILVNPLYNLVMQVNIHPVKVALIVRRSDPMKERIKSVANILGLMTAREVRKGPESNEITAVKLHLLSHVAKMLVKSVEEGDSNLDEFIKKLLRNKTPGGIPMALDVLIREGVRDFPYHDMAIFQQLVTNLNHTKLCEDPGAWGVLNCVINGQKGFRDSEPCATCGEDRSAKKCARCGFDSYCDKECQLLHWPVHKKYCKKKAEERIAKAPPLDVLMQRQNGTEETNCHSLDMEDVAKEIQAATMEMETCAINADASEEANQLNHTGSFNPQEVKPEIPDKKIEENAVVEKMTEEVNATEASGEEKVKESQPMNSNEEIPAKAEGGGKKKHEGKKRTKKGKGSKK